MTRSRWFVAVIVLVALAGVLLWVFRRGPDRVTVDVGRVTRLATFRSTVSASGEIVATRYADIGASAMGKIVKLAVAEGDRVRAGQLLARIDYIQAESEASGATAQMRALEAEERAATEQIQTSSAELDAAEARAREAARQFQRLRDLNQQGVIAAAELETARAEAEATAAQVASARASVARARQAVEAATRRVTQSRAQLRRATDVLSKTSIVAPIDGVVSRLRVREGEMVVVGIQNQPGTTLMTVSDLSGINAEVKVAEADVLRLAIAQPASVRLEALPGTEFSGKVAEIGASALPVSGTGAAAREFRVVVRLDRPGEGLRPGLSCDVEIVTNERRNVLTVPLQSVVIRGDADGKNERSGVFVVRDGRAAFVPVSSGVIGGLDIEVSGIDEGTEIIVGPYQVLRELNDGALVRVAPPARRS